MPTHEAPGASFFWLACGRCCVALVAGGGVEASFSITYLEYDGPHTELYGRLWRLLFCPLLLPFGLAWEITPGSHNEWSGHLLGGTAGMLLLPGAYLGHSVFTVTRREAKSFALHALGLSGILCISALCVIDFWHWDYLHMHG